MVQQRKRQLANLTIVVELLDSLPMPCNEKYEKIIEQPMNV